MLAVDRLPAPSAARTALTHARPVVLVEHLPAYELAARPSDASLLGSGS